jgi:TRAP-type C4-dicarboxylate transport system permease small subunit
MSDLPGQNEPKLPSVLGAVHAFDRRLQTAEIGVCAVALALMIVLAFVQVILRQLQGQTFQPVGWFDRVSMLMVIWVAMLGASVATAEGRHISIEALPKLLGPTGKRRLALVVNLVAAVITALMLALSLVYMALSQIPDPNHLFVVKALDLKVYRWPFLTVVPWGLTLMSLRFLLRAVEAVVLDDETFASLQHDEADDVAEYEDAHQGDEVSLLLDHARKVAIESGVTPALDSEQAREELKNAFRSDRWRAEHRQSGEPPRLVGRTTEELAIYQDLSDQGDVEEPERRQGGAVPGELTESGDILSSHEDMDDDELGEADTRRLDEAEEAVERVADTQRLQDASGDTAPGLEAPQTTHRLPDPELPDDDASTGGDA